MKCDIAHYRIENPSNVDTESALKELVDQANLAEECLDEIERLRAENLELQGEVFGPDGIRANQACIIADQAASISELEIEITELKADLEQSERVIDQQAAKIKELEAQLTITNVALENATRKPNVVYITGTGEIGADATKTIDQTPNSAENMQKTGPDSPKMAVWQITEERMRALSVILGYISYDADDDIEICSHAAVLRAMLTEAE